MSRYPTEKELLPLDPESRKNRIIGHIVVEMGWHLLHETNQVITIDDGQGHKEFLLFDEEGWLITRLREVKE